MDKLTRESRDHGEIFESLYIFQKLIPFFSSTDIEKFEKFLEEQAAEHFKFEDEEIFPVILKNGTQEEKALIQELQNQHKQILDMVNKLKKLISQYGAKPPEDQIDKFMELNTKIIERLLEHARKEDIKLFPILKKYEIDLK